MNISKVIKISSSLPILLTTISAGVVCTNISCIRNSSASNKEDISSIHTDTIAYSDSSDIEFVADIDDSPCYPVCNAPEDLQEFMQSSEHSDLYAQGILPGMLDKAPEYVSELLKNEHPGFIIVDKSRMKVIYYDKYGSAVKTYGMACAKNFGTKHSKGDSRTPEGFFHVEGVYNSTDWLFTDDDGVTSPKKGQFGPRFIRLLIPGTTQIGIHGTCAPWSIGGRSSHGCIRIKNENILELVELVEKGMPVIIVPGRKDMEQNILDGVEIPWIPSYKGAKEPRIQPRKEIVDPAPTDSICTQDTIPQENKELIQKSDTIILESNEIIGNF